MLWDGSSKYVRVRGRNYFASTLCAFGANDAKTYTFGWQRCVQNNNAGHYPAAQGWTHLVGQGIVLARL